MAKEGETEEPTIYIYIERERERERALQEKKWKEKKIKEKKKNATNFGFVLLNAIHSIFHLFSEGTVSTFHTALSPPILAPTVVCIAHAKWINSGCGRREAYKIWSMGFPE